MGLRAEGYEPGQCTYNHCKYNVPRGTLCAGFFVHVMIYVRHEEKKTVEEAAEDRQAAGFRRRGETSAGFGPGVAEILQAAQEAGHAASGRRRSSLVQEAGPGLPDEDQPRAPDGDGGREKKLALSGFGSRKARDLGHRAGLQVIDNAHGRVWLNSHNRVLFTL